MEENMKNVKRNGTICFEEEGHKYYDIAHPEYKFTSVTTIIEKFGQPFDKEFWSAYKALQELLTPDAWAIEKKSFVTST